MPNDNFTLDQFQRIAMTLSEILANRPQNRALARASDVPGADLQWMYTTAYPTGAWYGNLGELGTTAFRDALFTGCLALGVTCKVSGVPYSWGGAGAGWAAVGGGSEDVYQTFAALLAAMPSPAIGDSAQIASGGIATYTASGWLGDLGSASGLSTAPRIGAADGSRLTINGVSFSRVRGFWIKTRTPTVLRRPARYLPVGDSTAQTYSLAQTIIEGNFIPLPGSGQTICAYNSSPGAQAITMSKGVLLIGCCGISGETYAGFIARSAAAASTTRKATADVIAADPDVVYFALGANQVKLWGVSTTQEQKNSELATRVSLVKAFTSLGIHVVDHGVYGWDSTVGLTPSNLPYVREGIVEFNAAMADESVSDPYWHFIDPAYITHDGTGAYIPTCTVDGMHLNGIGAIAIAKATSALIDSIYEFGPRTAILYDPQKDFAATNAVAGVPANHSLTGAGTLSSKVSGFNKFSFRQVLASAGGFIFTLPALSTIFSGRVQGDRFYCQFRLKVTNVTTGLPHHGNVYARLDLYNAENSAGIAIFNDHSSSLCPDDCYITLPITLPISATDFGTSSKLTLNSMNLAAGTYDVEIYPYIIAKVE